MVDKLKMQSQYTYLALPLLYHTRFVPKKAHNRDEILCTLCKIKNSFGCPLYQEEEFFDTENMHK